MQDLPLWFPIWFTVITSPGSPTSAFSFQFLQTVATVNFQNANMPTPASSRYNPVAITLMYIPKFSVLVMSPWPLVCRLKCLQPPSHSYEKTQWPHFSSYLRKLTQASGSNFTFDLSVSCLLWMPSPSPRQSNCRVYEIGSLLFFVCFLFYVCVFLKLDIFTDSPRYSK